MPGSQPWALREKGAPARGEHREGAGLSPDPHSAGSPLPAAPPPGMDGQPAATPHAGLLQQGAPRPSPGPLLAACPTPQARPRSAAPPVPVRGGGEDRGAASPGRRVPRSLPAGPCPAVPRCRRRGPAALAALASSLTFPCLRRPSPAPSDVTAMATNPRPLPPRPPTPRARMRHWRQGAGPRACRGQ